MARRSADKQLREILPGVAETFRKGSGHNIIVEVTGPASIRVSGYIHLQEDGKATIEKTGHGVTLQVAGPASIGVNGGVHLKKGGGKVLSRHAGIVVEGTGYACSLESMFLREDSSATVQQDGKVIAQVQAHGEINLLTGEVTADYGTTTVYDGGKLTMRDLFAVTVGYLQSNLVVNGPALVEDESITLQAGGSLSIPKDFMGVGVTIHGPARVGQRYHPRFADSKQEVAHLGPLVIEQLSDNTIPEEVLKA